MTSYTCKWYVGSTKIKGATKQSYRVPSKFRGKRIHCRFESQRVQLRSDVAATQADRSADPAVLGSDSVLAELVDAVVHGKPRRLTAATVTF